MINNKYRVIFICLVALNSGHHVLKRSSHPQNMQFALQLRPGALRRELQEQERYQSPRALAVGTYWQHSAGMTRVKSGGCSEAQPRGRFSRRGQSGPCWASSCETATSKNRIQQPPLLPSAAQPCLGRRPSLASDRREALANRACKMSRDFRM